MYNLIYMPIRFSFWLVFK